MNKGLLAILICFPLVLISCASGPKEVMLQTGKKAFVISCETNYKEYCYLQAGEICELKGFDLFEKSQDGSDTKITISCRK